MDPSLQPSAEKEKQVFALIPFKNGLSGGVKAFEARLDRVCSNLVWWKAGGAGRQNEMSFEVPSDPNNPVIL